MKEDKEKAFVIVLTRVLQLCTYVPLRNMNDHSTVVCLKNIDVFVDFNLEKFSTHQGRKKV